MIVPDRLETDVYPALVRTYASVRRRLRAGLPEPDRAEILRRSGRARPGGDGFPARRLRRAAGRNRNFIALERTRGAPIDVAHLGGLAHGSLHPNRLGHELIEKAVSKRIEAVLAGRETSDPQPQPDRGPPPFVPEEIGVPDGPIRFPAGANCGESGAHLVLISQVAAAPDTDSVELAGLAPRSTVCFRTYRAEWESKRARPGGTVAVPVDVDRPGVASINEILFEEPGAVWKKLVVSRLGAADVG